VYGAGLGLCDGGILGEGGRAKGQGEVVAIDRIKGSGLLWVLDAYAQPSTLTTPFLVNSSPLSAAPNSSQTSPPPPFLAATKVLDRLCGYVFFCCCL